MALTGAGIAVVALDLDIEQLHRLSVHDYHRILESGGFDENARVELLDGLLAELSPNTRAHENAVAWLARWLIGAVDAETFEVRVASPLTLSRSEPEPDLAVIPLDAPRPYHPATATLIIEVAATSLNRDLGAKAELYATAGVQEYWVLDLAHRRVVSHRSPRSSDGYAETTELMGLPETLRRKWWPRMAADRCPRDPRVALPHVGPCVLGQRPPDLAISGATFAGDPLGASSVISAGALSLPDLVIADVFAAAEA